MGESGDGAGCAPALAGLGLGVAVPIDGAGLCPVAAAHVAGAEDETQVRELRDVSAPADAERNDVIALQASTIGVLSPVSIHRLRLVDARASRTTVVGRAARTNVDAVAELRE
jgi:hypothetical protein